MFRLYLRRLHYVLYHKLLDEHIVIDH